MRAELTVWAGVTGLAVLISAAASFGLVPVPAIVFVLVGLVVVERIGRRMATEVDRDWLPWLIPVAYLAHMVGALVQYYAVTVIYETGDSLSYHAEALRLVRRWRELQVPEASGGSVGTRVVELVTGLLYVPASPSLLVSFLLFASIAFAGSLMLYLAFRQGMQGASLRPYALLLFFLPSMVYWPSTIGKEALMIPAIGIASYGAAGLLQGGRLASLAALAVGLGGAAAIRPHVAAMLGGALVIALLFARGMSMNLGGLTRIAIVLLALVALWSLASLAMTRLGLEDGQGGLEGFLAERERTTQRGGSAVVGAPVSNPLDIPEAALRVLFRPLPHEASNAQAVLSALEGAALLALVVWKLPAILGRLGKLRDHPYLLFSLVFVAQFVVGFSAIFNLGILARQRTQALPFLLAIVVGLGWEQAKGAPARQPEALPVLR